MLLLEWLVPAGLLVLAELAMRGKKNEYRQFYKNAVDKKVKDTKAKNKERKKEEEVGNELELEFEGR